METLKHYPVVVGAGSELPHEAWFRVNKVDQSMFYDCYWCSVDGAKTSYNIRHQFTDMFAWAVPTREAIATIKAHAPNGVLEIGAGTGYWAHCLRLAGVSVIALDALPVNGEETNPYHSPAAPAWDRVNKGGPADIPSYDSSMILMLCWPPYNDPMGYDALMQYKGNTVVFIGEAHSGCTGDDNFHGELRHHWREVENVSIPQFPGLHDYLFVYERRDLSTYREDEPKPGALEQWNELLATNPLAELTTNQQILRDLFERGIVIDLAAKRARYKGWRDHEFESVYEEFLKANA